jgi:hypothetical protein
MINGITHRKRIFFLIPRINSFYFVFLNLKKPSESKNKIDTHGSNAETSKKLNTQLPASTSDESKSKNLFFL